MDAMLRPVASWGDRVPQGRILPAGRVPVKPRSVDRTGRPRHFGRDAGKDHEDGGKPSLRRIVIGLALGVLAVAGTAAGQTAPALVEVDVELVLASDISSSMDMGERYLQRRGHAEALRHPDVLRAIRAGLHGRIAVTYFEWSDPYMQRVVLPWTVIEDRASGEAAAQVIEAAPPLGGIRTSISGALDRARGMLGENGYSGLRQIIDIVGDGQNNAGRPLSAARADVLAEGITINGLAIMIRARPGGSEEADTLDRYFADALIGGPLSFAHTVRHRDDIVEAVRRKLVLEIAGLGPAAAPDDAGRPWPGQASR
jgi:hypothetical protein